MQTKFLRRILAIAPSTRGFGYAVFEGVRFPVHYGSKRVSGDKNEECIKYITKIIDLLKPHVIVLEENKKEKGLRYSRKKKLISSIKRLAKKYKIDVAMFPREKIQKCFHVYKALTKQEIAEKIASWMPEFEKRLPTKQKLWTSEDYRIKMFDAASLAIAFYHHKPMET